MSRAFVKEQDSGPRDEGLPERRISDHPNYVTPAGLAHLRATINELEERRHRLAPQAREDDAAREELAFVDRDLRYFTKRFETALLVDPAGQPSGEVAFGATVVVIDGEGTRQQFTIVGEDEADAAANKASYVSPLAVALLGAHVGDTVVWHRPIGNLELTVESIAYDAN